MATTKNKTEEKKEPEYKCPKCGDSLKQITSKKNGKHYWICQNAEEICKAIFSDRDGEPLLMQFGEPEQDCPCPDCGSPMRKITGGRYGDYYSCTAYPGCKGTIDIMPSGTLPPLCPEDPDHGPMRIRPGKKGKFLGCRRYPECSATLEMNGKPGKKPQHKENEDD